MPRWLTSLMIFLGFVALVLLALLPKNVTVNVNVEDETTINNNYPASDIHTAPAETPDDLEEN